MNAYIINTCKHTYMQTYIHSYIHIYIHTYMGTCGKMADEVSEGIENALNTIASTTERSGNMKKELKLTIYKMVSTLRNLFIKLKDNSDSKSKTISKLEMLVANMKAE